MNLRVRKSSRHSAYWLTCILASAVCTLFLLGCQQRPAVPTTAPAPTEPVVVIVVTATSQPTLAPTQTSEATITPIPALTPQGTTTITGTVRATIAAVKPTSVKATAIAKQPTTQAQGSAVPTSPAPSNFSPPQGIAPVNIRFSDGPAIKFQFTSVGPLTPDECYSIKMLLSFPGEAIGPDDYWVGLCGNQSNAGDVLGFEVKSGRFRDAANYGTLRIIADQQIRPSPLYDMRWTVTVVRVLDRADPVHPKVEALSPASAALQNSFFR